MSQTSQHRRIELKPGLDLFGIARAGDIIMSINGLLRAEFGGIETLPELVVLIQCGITTVRKSVTDWKPCVHHKLYMRGDYNPKTGVLNASQEYDVTVVCGNKDVKELQQAGMWK